MKAIFLHTKSAISISVTISCLGWLCATALAAVEVISTAAQCEAGKALRSFAEHIISSQRRCAFVCSHNPEKFLSLPTPSHPLYIPLSLSLSLAPDWTTQTSAPLKVTHLKLDVKVLFSSPVLVSAHRVQK